MSSANEALIAGQAGNITYRKDLEPHGRIVFLPPIMVLVFNLEFLLQLCKKGTAAGMKIIHVDIIKIWSIR